MTMIIDGTNGLTFNNSTTQASAGVVLQVVQGTSNTQEVTTSQSYVASSYQTLSITPKFATSKILIIVTTQINSSALADGLGIGIRRGASTTIADGIQWAYNTSSTNTWYPSSFTYLDSPSTTSSTSYTVLFKSYSGGQAKIAWGGGAAVSTFTLMEIAA